MGWGIEYTHKGLISNVLKDEIEAEIQQCEDLRKHYRDTLLCLSVSSAHEVKDNEGGVFFWEDYVKMRFTEIFDEMMENENLLIRLYQARDSKKITSY